MTTMDHTADGPVESDWRDSRWLAIAEVVVVALIFVADARHLIPFSKTPFIFVLGWVSLRVRHLRWRDVGLARYGSWTRTLLLGVAFGVALELLELLVTQPLLVHWLHKQPDLEMFSVLRGNIKCLFLLLALVWTLAAFGEEWFIAGT